MNKIFESIFPNRDSFNSNFFEGKTKKKNGTIKALLIVIIVSIVVEFFTLLPINLRHPGFALYLAMMLFIFVGLRSLFNLTFDKISKVIIGLGLIIAVYVFVGQFMSSPIFHAKSYQQQLSLDESADFYKDNEKVNYQSIPVVDKDSAVQLGDKKMGTMVEYVSQFEVDQDYTQINYQDTPYRVTTISYSDLIKWFTNQSEGLPAYIRVNMVTQDTEVVKLEDGMKYSKSDLIFRNINRYIRMKYPTKMFDDPTFEIDDNGSPFWIAPVYQYEIGLFGGKNISGAILVNAINGESTYYDISDVPQWVDKVYPTELLMSQLSNWGAYKNGWLNTLFSQKGVLEPTDGYNYIALDDDVYLYTGLTSVSSDASNVGFALINMRTKDAKYYAISGAAEKSAMNSAEGKVQNLGYKATFPILINAGGEPTYFLSLKDDAGLVKQYAFVSVENYQIVSTGSSVAEAEKSYYSLLSDNGKTTVESVYTSKTGKITSLSAAVVSGNTYYYFTLEGESTIYIAPISLSNHLPLATTGNTVTIEYQGTDSDEETVSSIKFN